MSELPKSIRDAVIFLAAASYDAGKHGATDSSSVRDASQELGFAIASEIAGLTVERDTLAALVDEAIIRERDGSLWSYGALSDYFKALMIRAKAARSRCATPPESLGELES